MALLLLHRELIALATNNLHLHHPFVPHSLKRCIGEVDIVESGDIDQMKLQEVAKEMRKSGPG